MTTQEIKVQFDKEIQERVQIYYTMGRQSGHVGTYGATAEQCGKAIEECKFHDSKRKEGGDYAPLHEAFVQGFADTFYSMD